MGNRVVALCAVLLLWGCGGYFNQHPANVRPESEAVVAVLAHERPATVAQSESFPAPTPRSAEVVTETIVPDAGRPASQSAVAPIRPPSAAPVIFETQPVNPPATFAAPLRPTTSGLAASAPPQAMSQAAPVATNDRASARAVAPPAPAPPPAVQPAMPVAEIPAAPVQVQRVASPPARPPPPPPAQHSPAVAMQHVPEMVSPPAAMPSSAVAGPMAATSPDAHCEGVARQRADDAAAGGLDRDTQEIVRKGAYADCIAWSRAHAPPP